MVEGCFEEVGTGVTQRFYSPKIKVFEVGGEIWGHKLYQIAGKEGRGEGDHRLCYQKGEESSYSYWALWAFSPNTHISDSDRFKFVCFN